MYRFRSITRTVSVGDKKISVDSKLEERIIKDLHAQNYTWNKPTVGINYGRHNYTPDLEFSVEFEGRTHRAILEIKPDISFFNPYIARRMLGIAKHYETELFLLYTDYDHSFYRLDKAGMLIPFKLPPPGKIPIQKLYKPVSLQAPSVYQHHYIRKIRPGITTLRIIANALDIFIKAIVPPRKKHRGKRKPLI